MTPNFVRAALYLCVPLDREMGVRVINRHRAICNHHYVAPSHDLARGEGVAQVMQVYLRLAPPLRGSCPHQ